MGREERGKGTKCVLMCSCLGDIMCVCDCALRVLAPHLTLKLDPKSHHLLPPLPTRVTVPEEPPTTNHPTWKHSQYFFRQWLRRQLQPFLCRLLFLSPFARWILRLKACTARGEGRGGEVCM